MKECDIVAFTRELIGFDTVYRQGDERACLSRIANLLEGSGLNPRLYPYGEKSSCLICTMEASEGDPIVFSGHIDTVPADAASWKADPWDGELSDGRLYGRGASDMKGGVACMVKAFEAFSSRAKRRRGAALVLTGGEEGGDEGSRYLAGLPCVLPRAGALVVGEPTGNYPFIAHKGALWLSCTAAGMAAHGSMPEKGENAIYKACEAILKLRDFDFKVDPHPILGRPTMNVGTIRGGMNVNSVPDQAVFTADIRTLPGMAHEALLTQLADYLGPGIGIGCIVSPEAVSSQPDTPWIQSVFSILERFIGERPLPRGLNYFTDASVLKPAMGNPQTVILGPGEASEAHRTNEWVSVDKLSACVDIYLALLEDYCMKPHKEETAP